MIQLQHTLYLFIYIIFGAINASENLFDILPPEVQHNIYKYFDVTTSKSMRLTSTQNKENFNSWFPPIFQEKILLDKHKKKSSQEEKQKNYFQKYTPMQYCQLFYEPDFKKLEEYCCAIKSGNKAILDEKMKILNCFYRKSDHGLGEHFNKKQLIRFFAYVFTEIEKIELNDVMIPKIKKFLDQFCLDEDYYITSLIKKITNRNFTIQAIEKYNNLTVFEINDKLKSYYGPVRGGKIFDYRSHLYECYLSSEKELKNLHYGDKENKYVIQKEIDRYCFAIFTTVLPAYEFSLPINIDNLDVNSLIQTEKKNSGIKHPSKVIKLYETLYCCNREYSKKWFLRWFQTITKSIEDTNSKYDWKTCQMRDLFCNEVIPCPLFEEVSENQIVYDVLKNRQYKFHHGDTLKPLYKRVLENYLVLSPLTVVKDDEKKLYEIIDDIVAIADHSAFMPWRKHLTDWCYDTPYLYLSILKEAGVFFYDELKKKLVQKMFFNTTLEIDLQKHPMQSALQILPSKYLADLPIPERKLLLFINFSDVDLFFSVIKHCVRHGATEDKILNFILPWIAVNKDFKLISQLLEKIKENSLICALYQKIQEIGKLSDLEKNDLKKFAIESKSPLLFLKILFILASTKEDSFAHFVLKTFRHKNNIAYHFRQFFKICTYSILTSLLLHLMVKMKINMSYIFATKN